MVSTHQPSMLNFHVPVSAPPMSFDSWLHPLCFTLSAYQPRGHQQSSLSTVCFIKSLNSRTLRPSASRWQVASAVELSGASESWVSLAEDAHGWLELLTVCDTDSKAICLQSAWAHCPCVCVYLCVHVCVHLTQVNWLPVFKAFCVKMWSYCNPKAPLSWI